MRKALVLALMGLTRATSAEEPWTRAKSPRVEVLSNGTETQARRAAAHLESFHRVMEAALAPLPIAPAPPPLVLAFRDRATFTRVLPLRKGEPQDVGGIILGGSERTYLAVDLGAEEADVALAHEYAHHVLNPMLAAQPPWLGEGLAELLARASVWPESATIGRGSEAHLRRIAREGPMPLRDLLAVGYLSPTYQGEGRALFYAQSWALVHWIVAGGHGGVPALVAYTEAIADGEEPGAAFARSFGMTLDAAQASLAAYLAAPPLPAVNVPLVAAASPAATLISTVAAAQVDVHLGDLLLRGGRIADARSHLGRALAGGAAGAQQAMAALLLAEGKVEEAQRHVEAALAADPGDARALQRRAEHIVREIARRGDVVGDADAARAAAVLERALAANPDLADAAELLARLRPAPLAHRIALLRRAVDRQPERAELAFTLSSLHVKRNDLPAAARVLRRARESTRDDAHRFLANHLLGKIAAVRSGQGVARGTLEEVECLPGGALAFRIRTESGPLRLTAQSPQALFVYDAEGDTVERDFTCGPTSVPVTAHYRSAPAGREAHRLLSLTFGAAP